MEGHLIVARVPWLVHGTTGLGVVTVVFLSFFLFSVLSALYLYLVSSQLVKSSMYIRIVLTEHLHSTDHHHRSAFLLCYTRACCDTLVTIGL